MYISNGQYKYTTNEVTPADEAHEKSELLELADLKEHLLQPSEMGENPNVKFLNK